MIIAVDGPAASGKGTIARALAAHFGLPHLDTGLLYRAVGLAVLRHGGDPAHEIDALRACDFSDAMLHDPEIRSEAASRAASVVSAHSAVRTKLLERQRAFARQPGGAVLDGRDIGTVVCPDAAVKLYVTASAEVRAKRRFDEELMRTGDADYEAILGEIEMRDARDMGRADSPLKPAADAHLLDTSKMSIETAFSSAIAIIDKANGK